MSIPTGFKLEWVFFLTIVVLLGLSLGGGRQRRFLIETKAPSKPTTAQLPSTQAVPITTDIGGICEICVSPNRTCSNPIVRHCQSSEPFCISKIRHGQSGDVDIIDKDCATDTECYNEWWLKSHGNGECLEALFSKNASHLHGYCTYCCKSSFGFHTPCNQLPWPENVVTYQTSGSRCVVGMKSYFEVDCPAARPLCMNTFIVTPGGTVVRKSCVAEESCYHSNTSPHCQSSNFTSTVFSDPKDTGFECHFCCKSSDNTTVCNKQDIPTDIHQVVSVG